MMDSIRVFVAQLRAFSYFITPFYFPLITIQSFSATFVILVQALVKDISILAININE